MATQKELDDWNKKSLSEVALYLKDEQKNTIINRLEKSIYHAFISRFKEDKTGESKILYDGKPVAFSGDLLELKEMFRDISNMLYINLNDKPLKDREDDAEVGE